MHFLEWLAGPARAVPAVPSTMATVLSRDCDAGIEMIL
jgi:hypothetical protein